MPEGNIERGSGKRGRDTEIESTVERPDDVVPEVQEVRHEEPEKWVREAAEELEAKESSEVVETEESSDVAKWVEQTVREVLENEDPSAEGKERAERWAREIAREVADTEVEGEAGLEEAESDESSSRPWEIRSTDELDASLERHSDLREEEDFDTLYEDAVEYCRTEDKEGVRPPELVRELEYRDLRELYEDAHADTSEDATEAVDGEAGEKIETSGEAVADTTGTVDEAAEEKIGQVGVEVGDETRSMENAAGDEVRMAEDAASQPETTRIDPEISATEDTGPIEAPLREDKEEVDGQARLEKTDEQSPRPWEVRSEEALDRALEHHINLKARKDYDDVYRDAVEYCRSEDKEGKETPELIKELEHRELRRAYESVHGGPPEVSINSMEDVDDLVKKYPDEQKRKGFDEDYRRCDVHFRVKDDHTMIRDRLAEKYDVSHGFVSNSWNDIGPHLIQQLRGYEEEKIVKEWAASNPKIDETTLRELHRTEEPASLEKPEKPHVVHQIDEHVVRESVERLRNIKEQSAEEVASAIEHMIRPTQDGICRIQYADLQSSMQKRELGELEEHLQKNRRGVEEALTKQLGLEDSRVRVATADGRLYTWIPKYRPDELVKAYESQFYYFENEKEILRVADELRNQLHVEGNLHTSIQHLNTVIRQLTADDTGNRHISSEHLHRGARLEGNAVRFYLDATGGRLSDLEGRVTKVTGINGQAGIENPKFPEGKDLQVLKARLAAVIVSDCHLRESGRITYNEEHPERIDIVQDTVRQLGDITLERSFRKGVYEVHIPNQIGLMMIQEGMTPGNKTINNPGLPKGYYDWCYEAKCAYLEELIPEDGNFYMRGRFSWFRSHAIYVDKEKENYDFESKIGPREINLVIQEGTRTKGTIDQYALSFGKLRGLQDTRDSSISGTARNLMNVALESRNRLIEDEKKIAESLGIEISLNPTVVKYFPETGRISVKWTAVTHFQEDAIHWASMCPPNDVTKREEVETWLRSVVENWLDKREWSDW